MTTSQVRPSIITYIITSSCSFFFSLEVLKKLKSKHNPSTVATSHKESDNDDDGTTLPVVLDSDPEDVVMDEASDDMVQSEVQDDPLISGPPSIDESDVPP